MKEPCGHGTVLYIDRGGGYTICKRDSMELCQFHDFDIVVYLYKIEPLEVTGYKVHGISVFLPLPGNLINSK